VTGYTHVLEAAVSLQVERPGLESDDIEAYEPTLAEWPRSRVLQGAYSLPNVGSNLGFILGAGRGDGRPLKRVPNIGHDHIESCGLADAGDSVLREGLATLPWPWSVLLRFPQGPGEASNTLMSSSTNFWIRSVTFTMMSATAPAMSAPFPIALQLIVSRLIDNSWIGAEGAIRAGRF